MKPVKFLLPICLLAVILSSCGMRHGDVIEDVCVNYYDDMGVDVGGILGSFYRKTYEDYHVETYSSSEFSCAERYAQLMNP